MKQSFYFFLLFLLVFNACTSETTPNNDSEDNTSTEIEAMPRQKVSIKTQYGEIIVELFNETPKHRDNFLKLAKEGFYDSLMFHRIQPNFMIQGGDPDSRGIVPASQALGLNDSIERIPAEINPNFIMRQGALCGFHTGLGRHPNRSSNGSQFIIIHGTPIKGYQLNQAALTNNMDYTPDQIHLYEMYGGSPQLDGRHTIFGQILEGTHILDKIVHAKTHSPGEGKLPDRPIEDIRMIVKPVN
jgi:cyclophilin family peptidyl-prolyl cis-trans isomerase